MFKFDTEERYDETGKSNIHSFNFSENYFAGGFYCCCVSCRECDQCQFKIEESFLKRKFKLYSESCRDGSTDDREYSGRYCNR